MDKVRWPGLASRLRGRPIADLWYDPTTGSVLFVFEDGSGLSVNADWKGCHVIRLSQVDLREVSQHTRDKGWAKQGWVG